ncbi:MAG: hypothetical protein ABIW46_01205, partial [Acidimicrobiales bacterium]
MSGALVEITGLPAGDLARLAELPGQIESVVAAAHAALEAVSSGQDAANPLAAVLAGLSGLVEQAGSVPALGELVAGVQGLLDGLPSGALGDLAALGEAVEEVVGLFGPLASAFRSGGVEQALSAALAAVTSVGLDVGRGPAQLPDALAGLDDLFAMVATLVSWRTSPPSPEGLADLVARAFAGVPLDLLDAPAAALEAALAPLDDILPEGPQLRAWRAQPTRLAAFWSELAVLAGAPTVDWGAIALRLDPASGDLLAAISGRDALLSVSVEATVRLELPGLDGVARAVAAVGAIKPSDFGAALETMKAKLRAGVAELEALSPTAEEMRLAARQMIDAVFAQVRASPLGQLRDLLIAFQERLIAAVESLPFRGLARELEQALARVADAVDLVDPEAARRPIRQFFDGVEARLSELSNNPVGDAVAALWSGVGDAIDRVADLVGELRDVVAGIVDKLQAFTAGVQPQVEELTSAVSQVRDSIDGFDLGPAVDAVVQTLHDLRDRLEEADLEALPAAAKAGLAAIAGSIRAIDISVEARAPIEEVLAAIDPTPLLDSAVTALSGLTDELRGVDPAAVASRLDAPVDALASALGRFGPGELQGSLDAALQPVRDLIGSVDVAGLLAPLTDVYGRLRDQVTAVLDPEAVFAPLEAAFQPVLDLVDAVDPARLLVALGPAAEPLGRGLGGTGPPASVKANAAILAAAVVPGPEADDPLLGFRPGDLLVPLIDLHRTVVATVDGVADSVVGAASALLSARLSGRLELLAPAGVEASVGASLASVLEEFDPSRLAEALEPAARSYRAAFDRLAASARPLPPAERPRADQVLAALADLDPLRLLPAGDQVQRLGDASARAVARLDLVDLRLSYAVASPAVRGSVGDFVAGLGGGAGDLRAALRALDPAVARTELNALFDRLGRRLAGMEGALMAALEELFVAAEEFLLPVNPASLFDLASRLHAEAREQVAALGPATFKDEVAQLFAVVLRQLSVLDPAFIVEELGEVQQHLVETLDSVAAS